MLGDGSSSLPLAPGSSSVGSGAFGGLQQQDRMVGAVCGGVTWGVPTLGLSCWPLNRPVLYLLIVPSGLPAAWI